MRWLVLRGARRSVNVLCQSSQQCPISTFQETLQIVDYATSRFGNLLTKKKMKRGRTSSFEGKKKESFVLGRIWNHPGPLVTVYSAAGCCLSPTATVTWQHILTSARFQREHSIHQVKLPKALLTAMRSNAASKSPHWLFAFFCCSELFSGRQ